ncbi:MAG: choice-of-anchor D domain-containing protein [Acidobacteriia bacterium]|nr:choice-of-anchor D domain-containing protein [Terriglobia bacterium]
MKSTLRFASLVLVVSCLLLLLGAMPVFGQITFSNFSDVTGLALNGSAAQATNGSGQQVLRLTPDGTAHVSGTAWSILTPDLPQQQSVSNGFTTVFQFQLTHAGDPADGIAFVIQNSMGDGFGTLALGGSGGAIGYGVPDPGDTGVAIPNSLAIEFDTYQNPWDPDANHIAVQSCGTDPNTQDHTAICPNEAPANLGIVNSIGLNGILLSDGAVHTAIIDYDGNQNTLRIFLDNAGSPVLTVNNLNLSSLLNLNEGFAWVGFTGATGALTENNDILNWTFTPATTTTTIMQTLTTGDGTQTTNYVFGSYNHKLQYTNANPDVVAVTAIPISQSDFAPRLAGTPFQNDQCAIYEGTGGLCVEFEVSCTGGADCTNLPYDLFNNFNTQDTITGPCMLKAPIDTNDWTNIIKDFTQTRNDPGSHGSTKGFSDFILVEGPNGQGCTVPPAIAITSPPNNSFWPVGAVPMVFTCTPDPTAPAVMTTSCTGTVVGPGVPPTPVNSGDSVTFTGTGPATLTVNTADTVLNTNSATSNFTIGQAPQFLSGNSAVFTVGTFGSFTVMTSGFPAASITGGPLPGWLSLVNHGDGTATLSGTPVAGSGGIYGITLTAHNGVNPDAMQNFTLTVNQAPAITSATSTTFSTGTLGSFTVTATGFPIPSLSEAGALPSGVTFTDNHNGTGTLGGTPSAAGTFIVTFTASNGVGSNAMQTFTLTVNGPTVTVSPTSINFGTVYQFSLLSKTVTITNTGTSTLSISKISVTDGTADGDDYTLLNFCGSSLSAGKSCKVYVVLWADNLGTRTATMNITDNAPGSPQQVSLTVNVIKKGH